MKYSLLFLLFFSPATLFSQKNKVTVSDLKPGYADNHFPEITSAGSMRVAEKINTFLQLAHLDHLPGVFKNHPFENIVYDPSANQSFYVAFYNWEQIGGHQNILSLSLSGEASGAYPEEFTQYQNFSLRTGEPVLLENLFTAKGTKAVERILNLKVKKTITDYLAENSRENETATDTAGTREADERQAEQRSMYNDCLGDIESNTFGYYSFYFGKDSLTFIRGRCSNHAMRALDDLDVYVNALAYKDLRPYLSSFGKALLTGQPGPVSAPGPDGKLFKGTINGKYPITALISHINSDNSFSMKYWYDKFKVPIEWRGTFRDGHFTMVEDDYHSEEQQAWIPRANIEAEWIGGRQIKGTWTDYKTKKVLDIALTVY